MSDQEAEQPKPPPYPFEADDIPEGDKTAISEAAWKQAHGSISAYELLIKEHNQGRIDLLAPPPTAEDATREGDDRRAGVARGRQLREGEEAPPLPAVEVATGINIGGGVQPGGPGLSALETGQEQYPEPIPPPDSPTVPGGGGGGGSGTAPVNVDVPAITGPATVGSTLSCSMGNWEGEPTSYAYQFKSDGADVTGMNETYLVADTDAGKSITCIVTATNAAGATAAP